MVLPNYVIVMSHSLWSVKTSADQLVIKQNGRKLTKNYSSLLKKIMFNEGDSSAKPSPKQISP